MYQKEEKFIKNILVKTYHKVIKKHTFDVMEKGYRDVVTTLDLKTEQYIIDHIKKEFPQDQIVSEEYHSLEQLQGRSWVIDPIDGTRNFANHSHVWCMQIAFVDQGKVQTSAIYIPIFKELYFASQKGAWCNQKPMHVDKVKTENAIVLYEHTDDSNHELKDISEIIISNLTDHIANVRSFGSIGVDYAAVACGQFHGVIFWKDSLWDYLPGSFLCEKAGGYVWETILNGKKIHTAFATKELKDQFDQLLKHSQNN